MPRKLTVVLRTPHATVVRDDRALPIARVNRPGRTDAARIVVREPDRVVVETPPGPAGRLVLADPPYPGWTVTRRREARHRASRTGSSAQSTSPPAGTASSGGSSPAACGSGWSSRSRRCGALGYAGSPRAGGGAQAHAPQRSASTSGASPSASSAGGALGQIESATTRPLAASVAISARMRSTLQPPGAGKPASGVRLGSSTSVSTCT